LKQQVLEQALEEDKTLMSMLIAICKNETIPHHNKVATIQRWLESRLKQLETL
jgi:hypothetical protein